MNPKITLDFQQVSDIYHCLGFVGGVLLGIRYHNLDGEPQNRLRTACDQAEQKLTQVSIIIDEAIENAQQNQQT